MMNVANVTDICRNPRSGAIYGVLGAMDLRIAIDGDLRAMGPRIAMMKIAAWNRHITVDS